MSPSPDAPLVPVDEHLSRVLSRIEPMPVYDQPLLEALGLPVTEDVAAPVSLPLFDNSAMDGYAVRVADVARVPVVLPVVGAVPAGSAEDPPAGPVSSRE